MTSILTDIIEIGAVGAGLTFLFVVFRRVLGLLSKVHDVLDDWNGTPARPGVPEKPGVMVRLEAIEHELHPNSQLSMRDAVDRIEQAVTTLVQVQTLAQTPETD